MITTSRRLLTSILVLALLALPTAVLAKELGKLTISGPGIKGELTLDDPAELTSLWEAGIIDTNGFAKAPEGLGEGYTITTYMHVENDQLLPFIQMVYYPAEAGQAGYVHITGRLDKVSISKADEWTRMNLSADRALRRVMSAHGVELLSALPAVSAAAPAAAVAVPAASAAPAAPAVSPYIGWTAVVLGLGAVLLLRRRSMSRRSA